MNRVAINPELIKWARVRSGFELESFEKRFPRLDEWESGARQPTFKQLEDFAAATLTPFGAFFLAEPPVETLPIPDFRTTQGKRPRRPSAALLETIYSMQRRQDWLREYLIEEGCDPSPFVGSATLRDAPEAVAQGIRTTLGIGTDWARSHSDWEKALLDLRRRAEDHGILVMINGVFGNNTHVKLDPQEFRGFVLSDEHAPLIFVNGADAKSAQMFTIAHELAHVWLGQDSLFDLSDFQPSEAEVERFCNSVAAEFLVTKGEIEDAWPFAKVEDEPFKYLARRFKVSPVVAARRALDLRFITRREFNEFWKSEVARIHELSLSKNSRGSFYGSQAVRVGHRFGTNVVRAAREGKLLYSEAYRLTGLSGKSFDTFAESIGMGRA